MTDRDRVCGVCTSVARGAGCPECECDGRIFCGREVVMARHRWPVRAPRPGPAVRRRRRTRGPGRRHAPPGRTGRTRPGKGISLVRHAAAMVHLRDGSESVCPVCGAYSQCPIQGKSVSRVRNYSFKASRTRAVATNVCAGVTDGPLRRVIQRRAKTSGGGRANKPRRVVRS